MLVVNSKVTNSDTGWFDGNYLKRMEIVGESKAVKARKCGVSSTWREYRGSMFRGLHHGSTWYLLKSKSKGLARQWMKQWISVHLANLHHLPRTWRTALLCSDINHNLLDNETERHLKSSSDGLKELGCLLPQLLMVSCELFHFINYMRESIFIKL